uniref:L antigen family member 3 n=1 Tax=Elaeophora elaphi TaxID=1147741 RepID=A0A0R3S3E7_9BILA
MNDEKQLDESVNDLEDCSDENTIELRNADENHKAILHIDLGSEEKAQIICKTLAVDKEPSRSTAKRTYSVRGHHLVVEVVSLDTKYLQKSIDNLFDMYHLANQTIEEVTKYQLKMPDNDTDATLSRNG